MMTLTCSTSGSIWRIKSQFQGCGGWSFSYGFIVSREVDCADIRFWLSTFLDRALASLLIEEFYRFLFLINFHSWLKILNTENIFFLNVSQNGKFSYGYASSPGKRSSMEDFYETRIDGVEGEIVGLFGVFDGMWSFLFDINVYI